MSEKKVKQLRKQEKQQADVRASLTINVFNNGGVNVHGPIDHPAIVFDMLAGGLRALAAHYTQKAGGSVEPSRIIKPKPVMPLNPMMKVN